MFFKRLLCQQANLKKTGEVEMWVNDGRIITIILRKVVKCPMVLDACSMREWRIYHMRPCTLCMCDCVGMYYRCK